MGAKLDVKENRPISTSSMSARKRIQYLDAFRGLIMVIMAIYHVAYFIMRVHPSEFWGRPLPAYTSAISFLTRAITHVCAPGFMFIMGASVVFLAQSRQRSSWDDRRIRSFIVKRGCILIALEMFFLNFAWLIGDLRGITGSLASPGGGTMPGMVHFGILSCLGCNLMLAGLMRKWSPVLLFGISLVTLLSSQLITPPETDVNVLYSPILRVLFIAGKTQWLEVGYPILPWLTFVIWGIIFGRLLGHAEEKAMKACAVFGLVLLVFFVVYRVGFGYGDPHSLPGKSWIDYLNVTKYPPSTSFTAITMGINLLVLFAFWKLAHSMHFLSSVLGVYGRTPLFFYVLHILLYLLLGTFTLHISVGYTTSYLIWLISLAALYPVCLWFSKLKTKAPPEAIIRFF